MDNLTIVGVDGENLIVVSSGGERFHLPINDALLSALRKPASSSRENHRASPKDIQAHIRRGLTATQVADLTGEDLAYIEKFEGAVIAERAFAIEQALAVGVTQNNARETTFGQSVRSRLDEIDAHEDSWGAWKEETGWNIELVFHEGDVEHRARWSFDPRKHLLVPLNDDAQVLSRHEPMPTTLIPRLSAVPATDTPDRFDSEIFEDSDLGETGPLLEAVPYGRQNDSPDAGRMADTADLLEVLRRKRGEREGAPEGDGEPSRNAHPSTGGIRLVESYDDHTADITAIGSSSDSDDDDDEPTPPPASKKNRPEMPSWDDIVFGARGDDDPA